MTYNMTIEQIKSLLARFYEGQTTPEEERLLADFFRREDVPEDVVRMCRKICSKTSNSSYCLHRHPTKRCRKT